MSDKEKTRVTNFIKKQTDIDLSDIREVANHYRQLNGFSKLITQEMSRLKGILLESEVNEYFLDDKEKVVFEEGKSKSFMDPQLVLKDVGQEIFMELVSVSKKAITDKFKDDIQTAKILIAKSEVTLNEKTSPSVKVGKMTQKELKEGIQ